MLKHFANYFQMSKQYTESTASWNSVVRRKGALKPHSFEGHALGIQCVMASAERNACIRPIASVNWNKLSWQLMRHADCKRDHVNNNMRRQ